MYSAWWRPGVALAGFAFPLHYMWEFFQVPLFRGMAEMPHWQGIQTCTMATMGDVGIALVAYALTAAGVRDRWWPQRPSWHAMGWFVTAGVIITIALEWLNVYIRGRWGYAPAMPVLLGVGLSPLAQWVVVPPVTVWLAYRHLGTMPRSTSPTDPETSR